MHSEADAFLDAIFDHPDDDTHRLVYADWLEEHGQGNYAQFIRLSVKADGRCRSLEERQQVRAERFTHWRRMPAFLSTDNPLITTHNYKRGFPGRVDVPAEFFVRTVERWWPVFTPAELAIYAMNGREDEVARLSRQHLSWIRKLQFDTRIAKDDHDLNRNPPLLGTFLEQVTQVGAFSKLESLTIEISSADRAALESLANSELVFQLRNLYIEFQFSQPNQYGVLSFTEQKRQPDAVKHAIIDFLYRYRDRL